MRKAIRPVLLLLICVNTNAQLNWQRVNSPNENISSLTAGSAGIYAGTFTYGVYQSADEGVNWNNISLGLPDSTITSLQTATDDKLFAGTGSHGIWQHNGISWQAINNGLPAANLSAIAFAKGAAGNMYMMANTGKIYSWNGSTWSDITFNFPSLGRDIAVGPTGILYGGAFASGIYQYDGTGAWSLVGAAMPNSFVTHFTVSLSDTLFVTCNSNNVFKCAATGGSWISINTGLPAVNMNEVHSDSQNRLFIATSAANGTIYRSLNGGLSWTLASASIFSTSFSCFCNGPGNKLYAGASGVFMTADAGSNWSDLNPGMIAPKSVSSFTCSPAGTFFLSSIYGPWRSLDNGYTWQLKNVNVTHLFVLQIMVNAAGDILMHAHNNTPKGAIYRSVNNGDSWTQVAANGCDMYTKLKQHNADTIWASSRFSGATSLSYSINNGATWVNNPLSVSAIWDIDFSKPGTIFIGSESEGVSRSDNGGQNFTLGVGNTIPWYGNVIEIETDANGVIFAGGDWWTNILWFSSPGDNGNMWTKFNDPDLVVSGSQDLVFDQHNNAYLACENNGIRMAYNSNWDENTNWIKSNNGLPSPTSFVNEFGFDTTGYMYAVCYSGNGHNAGLYKSSTVVNPPLSATYTFTGNGNWSLAANWKNNRVPPAVLTGNAEIIIDPVINGECVLDTPQQVSNGAVFKVTPGKKFRILGNMDISQ